MTLVMPPAGWVQIGTVCSQIRVVVLISGCELHVVNAWCPGETILYATKRNKMKFLSLYILWTNIHVSNHTTCTYISIFVIIVGYFFQYIFKMISAYIRFWQFTKHTHRNIITFVFEILREEHTYFIIRIH